MLQYLMFSAGIWWWVSMVTWWLILLRMLNTQLTSSVINIRTLNYVHSFQYSSCIILLTLVLWHTINRWFFCFLVEQHVHITNVYKFQSTKVKNLISFEEAKSHKHAGKKRIFLVMIWSDMVWNLSCIPWSKVWT